MTGSSEATMGLQTDTQILMRLRADTQILMSREFDMPRDLIYRAWTTPDLIKQWWGGEQGEVAIPELDLRVGGKWRYVLTAKGGYEAAFHGEYWEVVPDVRIVMTETYESMPETRSLNTVTFADKNGRTALEILVQYTTRVHRDARVYPEAKDGLQEAMKRLERVAASLR
jgi:uncharacterized protein YndB with AHSA1/START domain